MAMAHGVVSERFGTKPLTVPFRSDLSQVEVLTVLWVLCRRTVHMLYFVNAWKDSDKGVIGSVKQWTATI